MLLIDNAKAITFEEAIQENKSNLLLYKYRVCKYCDITFNIEKKGILYWCGCNK